jgi:hypothetical protein
MSTYDNPMRLTVALAGGAANDLGDGASAVDQEIPFPPNTTRARVRDIAVQIDETFACDTTPASIDVGDGTDIDAYASLSIPDATATTANTWSGQDDPDFYISTADNIADITIDGSDKFLTITFTNGVDAGTEAGIVSNGYIVIDFF